MEGHFVGRTFCREGYYVTGRFVLARSIQVKDTAKWLYNFLRTDRLSLYSSLPSILLDNTCKTFFFSLLACTYSNLIN